MFAFCSGNTAAVANPSSVSILNQC